MYDANIVQEIVHNFEKKIYNIMIIVIVMIESIVQHILLK